MSQEFSPATTPPENQEQKPAETPTRKQRLNLMDKAVNAFNAITDPADKAWVLKELQASAAS